MLKPLLLTTTAAPVLFYTSSFTPGYLHALPLSGSMLELVLRLWIDLRARALVLVHAQAQPLAQPLAQAQAHALTNAHVWALAQAQAHTLAESQCFGHLSPSFGSAKLLASASR